MSVSNGFSFEALLSGAIFGYLYLMEEENQPTDVLLGHLKQQLQQMNLSKAHKKALYYVIQKRLNEYQKGELGMEDFMIPDQPQNTEMSCA